MGPSASSRRRWVLGCLSLASVGAATSSASPSRRKKSRLAMACSPLAGWRQPSQQIGLHAAQDLEQLIAVAFGDAVERLAAGERADGEDIVDQRMGGLGEAPQAKAAVLVMSQPIDQSS